MRPAAVACSLSDLWRLVQLQHVLKASAWRPQCAAAVAAELTGVMQWTPRLRHGTNCLLDPALHSCKGSRCRPVQHHHVYLLVRMMLGYMAATSR